MENGVSWIASAFKLFDALINPRRSPQPDRPVGGPAPEASNSSPASTLRLELTPETDTLAAGSESRIESSRAEQIEGSPVQRDDESRRQLIRQLFNDYWNGIEDKPPTFAKRLEIAERYINDQLADRDVSWRLDAVTRKQLGLPSSPIAG